MSKKRYDINNDEKAGYAGFPAALNSINAAKEVFAERDEKTSANLCYADKK